MDDITDFLKKILPRQGYYVLATNFKGKTWFKHTVYSTVEDLATAAMAVDNKGNTAFHACASYISEEGVWNDRKQKYSIRSARNTAYVRSQWLDVDVGPGKDYATRKEALAALLMMCKALKIPAPMMVASSNTGIHCYWVFLQDVPTVEAKVGATAFAEALHSVGFKHDPVRTADMASVLRPVGTHHRKGDPIKVKILRDADAIDHKKFYSQFAEFRKPAPLYIKGAQAEDTWSSGTNTYPPSSAKIIVKSCAVLNDFARHDHNKPHMSEPLWYGLTGLLKHTTEGEKLAHYWSKKADSRYDEGECQDKIDGWEQGPTSCEYFSKRSNRCAKCPKFGTIKGPIQLGFSEDKPPVDGPDTPIHAQTQPANQQLSHYSNLIPDSSNNPIKFWPKGYCWQGEQLKKYMVDEAGKGDWVPFSNTLYYPFLRYETEDKTRAIMVCALTDPKKGTWRTFEMDTAKVADPRALATALGAQEIVYMPHSKERNMKFVQDVLHGIRGMGLETTTYNTFGWHDAGFVIGDKMLTKKKPVPIFLGTKVPSDLQGNFGVSGTASEWSAIVDEIYNRVGAEPYQFIICCGFAATLVKLCDSDMWHGIPAAVTGDSGEGKTTICKVACSIFGNPKKSMIQANDEGTTINALIQRIATMGNLPMLLDEITGRETSELQSVLFALSNGEPKRRLRPDGTEIGVGQSWDTIAFITGNLSITRMLADSDRAKADATQVRCFEIPLHKGDAKRVFGDVNGKEQIEHKLLSKNYGAVGLEFLKYVIRNKDRVTIELQALRAKIASTHHGSDPRERFYYDLIANALVAAGIAKKLGLINFDIKALKKWALNHVVSMRSFRSESLSTPEDYLQAFLGYLHQHTVITKYYRDGREKLPGGENIIPPMRDPLSRHAVEDRRFLVTCTAFNQWCISQKVAPDWLRSHLEKEGYLMLEPTGGLRQRICKGSGLGGVQARCMEFNYDMLDDKKLHLPDYISEVTDSDQIDG